MQKARIWCAKRTHIYYYLHTLDRVAGAAHFEVAEPRALSVMQELRTALPGYLVPRLVHESAGEAFTQPIVQKT